MSLETNLISSAYFSAIYLGGGFVTKNISMVGVHCWNYYHKTKLSQSQQKTIERISEIVGGLSFVILAIRHLNMENARIQKQIDSLKSSVKFLEQDVDSVFKTTYSKTRDAIKNMKINF